MKAEGVVEAVSFKGKGVSTKIGDDWFGCGFGVKEVPFVKGDRITFDYSVNGNFKNLDIKSVQVQRQQPSQGQAGTGNVVTMPPSRYETDRAERDAQRQRAITFQASRNAAIELAQIAAAGGYLPLPAKKGDQLDALLGFVDDLARRLYIETEEVAANGVGEETISAATQTSFDDE